MSPHLKSTETLIAKVYSDPRYSGKQIIVSHGKVISTSNSSACFKKLRLLLHQYPDESPTVIYVPTAETLILIL